MQAQVQSLDAILEEFDSGEATTPPEDTKPVGFHIPDTYKMKYDRLQEKSKFKFGKTVTKLIMASIDRASIAMDI